QTGSVRVVPSSGSQTPSALAIFSYRNGGVTVSEAGVPALTSASAFRTYAEVSGTLGQPGSIQTGIAIAGNPGIMINFELTGLDGTTIGLATAAIPATGVLPLFLNQLPGFASLPLPIPGVVRVSTSASPGISLVGLRGR